MLAPANSSPAKLFWPTLLTLLDEQGTAVRLGCSPADSERALITVPVAIALNAVYAARRAHA